MTTATRNTTSRNHSGKPPKAQQAQQELATLLATISARGFYGTAGITLSVQDGTIQHLKINTERMVK